MNIVLPAAIFYQRVCKSLFVFSMSQKDTNIHTHICYIEKRKAEKKRIILRMKKLHKQIVFSFFFISIWWLFDLWLFFRYVHFLLLLIFFVLFFTYTYKYKKKLYWSSICKPYFGILYLFVYILIFLSYRSVLMSIYV